MQRNKEKSHVREVLAFFVPEAWKKYKGYFFLGGANVLLTIIAPFINILMLPLIINELCGERSITRLLVYAAILVGGERLISAGYRRWTFSLKSTLTCLKITSLKSSADVPWSLIFS